MKKYTLFSLLLVVLTSCGSFSPFSVTINGKTYKTGFYRCYGENLTPLGIEPRDFSTSEHKQSKYHYWALNNEKFHMYFGQNEEAIVWAPTIYCISEDLREAKEYYADLNNYNYYLGEYLNEQSYNKVSDDKYYSAIEAAIKIMITKPFSRKQNKKIDLSTSKSLTLFRTSKDNLFTTLRDEFFYNEELGFIYVAAYFDDSKDSVYYTFTKENNELLVELYNSLMVK